MESNETKLPWEPPTLVVLGDLATITAVGANNGGDGASLSGGIT